MQPIIIFDANAIQSALTPSYAYVQMHNGMNLQAEVDEVKRELVEVIVSHLRSNQMNVAKARQLAETFLALLPIRDQQDLLLKLKDLSQEYVEAREIYAKEVGRIAEAIRHTTLSSLHDLIKQGRIEQAIAVAKQASQAS